MGKKRSYININKKGDTLKLEIKDQTYRVMHRGNYRLQIKSDVYNLLTIIEKYTPFTIQEILNMQSGWV